MKKNLFNLQNTKKLYQQLLLLLILFFSGKAWGQTTFSTPGTYTWTCPPNVTTIQVEAWGGGGAGGGTGTLGVVKTGGGGGGGAYAKTSSVTVVPGNNYTIIVGAGGTGVSAANGNAGGNSSFGSLVIAAGGNGGTFTNTATGGPGGSGGAIASSTGTTIYRGGNGATGTGTTTGSGAGGSGGGTAANGGDASGITAGTVTGGGSGASGKASNGDGNSGSAPGGGGSGSYGSSGSTTARLGGAGGAGRVILTYTGYCTPTSSSAYYITSVSTSGGTTNFTNTSVNGNGYSNFYDTKQAIVSAGNNFSVSFAGVTGSTFGWAIWIDWNKNNVFDSGERVYVTSGYVNSGTSGTITVPASQAAGDYVMRILADYNLSNPSNSCSFTSATNGGEAEDYKLTVSALSSCTAPISQPSSLIFGTTSASTVNASFTGVASPNTPSGYLILRSTSATAPTLVNGTSYTTNTDATIGGIVYRVLQGSATASLATSIAETGLDSNTIYYYYIYSYNSGCTGQPYYLTTSALTGNKITCPAPATNTASTVTNTGVSVSWTASVVGGSAEAIKYRFELYSDSGRTTPVVGYPLADTTSPVNITSGLTVNTNYYYRIIAYNSSCQSTNLDGSFYNGVCVPGTTSNTTHYISNFTTTKGYSTNINKTSTYVSSGYQDNYATDKVEMYPSGSFDFSYTTVGSQLGTSIWIDWNNDWVFDTSERVFTTTATGTAGGNGTIAVPAGKALGDYRMRVRTERYASSPDNPCSSAFIAETEDYKISVVAQPDYVIYTDATTANNTVNNTVNNTLNIYFKDFDGYNNFYTNDQLEIWMHAGIKTPSATWLYQNPGQDFNNTSTLIKFTRESTNPNVYKATVKLADWFCIPTGTTVEGLNLVFRNQYGVGGNNQTADMVLNLTSAAVTVNVSTIGIASAVTTNSATISWTGPTVGAVKGFDYYYSTSSTAPTAGTAPSGTVAGNVYIANLSSLSPATTYYFWVRTKGCDTNSAWTASGNFTTACTNITTFPWTENFDTMATIGSGIVPNCWKTVTGTKAWVSSNASTDTYNDPRSTPNYMSIAYGNGTASQLWTPTFTLTTGKSYDISFYYNTGTGATNTGWTGNVLVNNSQDITGATTLGSFVTSTQATSGYVQYKYTFTPSATGNYTFALNVSSTSAPWNLGVDDFRLEETPATLLANNASTASLSFADQAITTTSATQSFNLSGLMLTGAPGTITISAPAGFEVSSVDNTSWGTSTTINYSSSTLADKQVNVRFKPTDCTSISNAALTISGGGATVIPTVTLSGKGTIPAPTATVGTDITASTFTANWTAVTGAIGYVIDVYKKEVRPNATDLFISEYIEGSSNNKYIEIYNGTGVDVNLNDYRLRLFSNGSSTADADNQLTGFLANNSTKVYKNSSATLTLPIGVTAENNSAVAFNGDDAIALYKISSSSYVDIFGRIGNDPGTAWTGTGGYTTLDKTLIRKPSILNGVTVSPTGTGASAFTTLNSEWDMYNVDTVSNLGAHSFDGGTVYTQVLHNQATGNVTSYNVSGLDANTKYYYVVRAITSTCESVNSNEIEVTTTNTIIWNNNVWTNTTGPNTALDAIIRTPYYVKANADEFAVHNLTIENTGLLKIKTGHGITVSGDIITPDNKIIIESDASLTQTKIANGNSNNKAIAKRNVKMKTLDYTYWSSPLQDQVLLNTTNVNAANSSGGFSAGTPNNRTYEYNEVTDNFKATTNATFVPAKGYAIRGKSTYGTVLAVDSLTFSGNLHNGDYSIQIQKSKNTTGTGGVIYEHGYNLIGNPYPSNINFINFYNLDQGNGNKNSDVIYGKAWFWTNFSASGTQAGSSYAGNNYATITLAGGTSPTSVDSAEGNPMPNEFIKVAQGFIVQMKGTPPTGTTPNLGIVKFDNSIRTNNNTGHFYNNNKNADEGINRYWVKIVSPYNIANTILIAHMDGATNNYDPDYDAELLAVGDDSFYSKVNAQKLQIQARNNPLNNEDVIVLGTKHAMSGLYKISLGNREGVFAENQKIYLRDKLTETYTDLTIQDYSFNANQGIDDNRFEIVYKNKEVLGTEGIGKSDFLVYRDGNNFVVKSSNNLGKVELYDVTGKLVQSRYSSDKEVKFDSSVLISGVYIIKAENSGNIRTKKIIK